VKLKKLHKMGDVGNTILKYLENEKTIFVKIRSIFSVNFIQIFIFS